MSIDELNASFAISDHLTWVEGPGGLPIARANFGHAETEISLHGAHVLSFKIDGEPIIWLSKEAVFNGKKAIRGGVPVCWPWFADHPTDADKPAHGVARTSEWRALKTEQLDDGIALELGLTDSEQTREVWDHAFELRLSVELKADSLTVTLTSTNIDSIPLEFGCALHTYFAISGVHSAYISGLENVGYIDSIDNDQRKVLADAIHIDREVDRIYTQTESAVLIHDPDWDRTIRIDKTGSASTVVWNPWIDKAARMSDFGDDEYLGMVCVETTNAADDVRTVAAGESHTISQTISLA
ncbi:MAG: D-hexose-6-phosphate mutarotase [Verrucomicrobiota bacterium]